METFEVISIMKVIIYYLRYHLLVLLIVSIEVNIKLSFLEHTCQICYVFSH